MAYSVDYTFKDVHEWVGKGFREAQEDGLSQASAFRRIWRDVNVGFERESRNRLGRRLEIYEGFLKALGEGFGVG